MTRRGPLIAVILLAVAALAGLLALLPAQWFEPAPTPPAPIPVELIAPARAPASRPTSGMIVGADGFGTVLSAPARLIAPPKQFPLAGAAALAPAPAIPPQLAPFIRLLARIGPRPAPDELIVTTLEAQPHQFARIILRAGCLRFAESGEPHAILPAGTKLYVDSSGYLTLGIAANAEATNPRVGELLWWEGRRGPPPSRDAVAPIRARCGPGEARFVGLAQSVAASQAVSDGVAARNFADRHGVPWDRALAYVRECRARLTRSLPADASGERPVMIENMCGSMPPNPVLEPGDCPPGTSLSGGLCRTPEGFIGPIPQLQPRV